MIDFEFFNLTNALSFVGVLSVAIITILLGKKISYGIFDPWFPVLLNQLIYAAVFSALYFNKILSRNDYIYFVLTTLFFLIPFYFVRAQAFPLSLSKSTLNIGLVRFIKFLLISLAIYQLSLDTLFVLSRGLPVLSDSGSNPQIYVGGFGIVKYVHDSTKYIVPPIAVYLLFATANKKWIYLGLIITIYPAVLFEWSKLGLLSVFANFWVASLLIFGSTRKIKNLVYLGLCATSAFIFFMFVRVAATGYGENAFDAFAIRLVQTIDSGYIYFVLGGRHEILQDFSYLKYSLSLISPFFGIDASKNGIGHLLLHSVNMNAEDGYGPSPPFQIIGHIFMGNFGFLYALFISLILVSMKNIAYKINQYSLIPYLILYNIIGILSGDVSLIIYYLFIIIFLIPPFLISYLLYLSSVKNVTYFQRLT